MSAARRRGPPAGFGAYRRGRRADRHQAGRPRHHREAEMMEVLRSAIHPARNPEQNIADLRAQLAANEKGVQELHKMVRQFGWKPSSPMWAMSRTMPRNRPPGHERDCGSFTYPMDNGQQVGGVSINARRARRWWISPAPAGRATISTRRPRSAARRSSMCSARSSMTTSR